MILIYCWYKFVTYIAFIYKPHYFVENVAADHQRLIDENKSLNGNRFYKLKLIWTYNVIDYYHYQILKQLLIEFQNNCKHDILCMFEYFLKIEYLEQERQSSTALKEETQALKEQITNKEDVLKELESIFYGNISLLAIFKCALLIMISV